MGVIKRENFYYPFVKEYLELGFYLSVVFGEYDFSQRFLNSIRKINTDSQNDKLEKLLVDNVKLNNSIINDTYLENNDITNKNLSISHLYLLLLKSDFKVKNKIINLIKINDSFLAEKLLLRESTSNLVLEVIIFLGVLASVLTVIYMH